MLNSMKMARIALVLGIIILIMGTVATFGVYADTQDGANGAPAVQTEAVSVDNTIGIKAIASAIAIGFAAAGGAIAMGISGAKASESISRQPEAEGKIRTSFMLGLVFIETAIIYALLVVILIIFVL